MKNLNNFAIWYCTTAPPHKEGESNLLRLIDTFKQLSREIVVVCLPTFHITANKNTVTAIQRMQVHRTTDVKKLEVDFSLNSRRKKKVWGCQGGQGYVNCDRGVSAASSS